MSNLRIAFILAGGIPNLIIKLSWLAKNLEVNKAEMIPPIEADIHPDRGLFGTNAFIRLPISVQQRSLNFCVVLRFPVTRQRPSKYNWALPLHDLLLLCLRRTSVGEVEFMHYQTQLILCLIGKNFCPECHIERKEFLNTN